jgi:hypothetical protein
VSVSRFAALAGIPERTYWRRLARHRAGDPAKGPWPAPKADAVEATAARVRSGLAGLCDLHPRQQPTETWLGALAQLDLQCPHRRLRNPVLEPCQIEPATLVATTEVGGADLPDQLSAGAEYASSCDVLARSHPTALPPCKR